MSPKPFAEQPASDRLEVTCSRCSAPTLLTRDALRRQERERRKPVCGECRHPRTSPVVYRSYRREYSRISNAGYDRQDVLDWRAANNSSNWLAFEDWQTARKEYASWWKGKFSPSEIQELAAALSPTEVSDHSRPARGRKQRTRTDRLVEPLYNGTWRGGESFIDRPGHVVRNV